MNGLERNLSALRAHVAAVRGVVPIGRVYEISAGAVRVEGISAQVSAGDEVSIPVAQGALMGEITAIGPAGVMVQLDGAVTGIRIGDPVVPLGPARIAPDPSWIGRIVDPYGLPMDGRPLRQGTDRRPLDAAPPAAATRNHLGARIETGLAVFDTFLPLVRGQRIGLFAGSGVGKSMLLGRFARDLEADVIVLALIGERGREVRDYVERVLGPRGMRRTVVVAATSDQSAVARRRCALAAMAVAERFRDDGAHVALIADSVTRFAEAHREVALAAGEAPSLRGYPPSTAHRIMALAERAGPGGPGAGDITAVFTVLVAGSDMDEPVADILRGVLDGHVILDRAIAERGRYPAVDLLRSVSRSLPDAATVDENALLADGRHLLGAYARAELIVQSGLYAAGSDPLVDRAVRLWPALDRFIASDAPLASPDDSAGPAGNGDDAPVLTGAAEAFSRLRAILEGDRVP
jgi:flagellum-specific ATP synthase